MLCNKACKSEDILKEMILTAYASCYAIEVVAKEMFINIKGHRSVLYLLRQMPNKYAGEICHGRISVSSLQSSSRGSTDRRLEPFGSGQIELERPGLGKLLKVGFHLIFDFL